MLDQAGIYMAQGEAIVGERIAGINDNMMASHFHPYYELYYLEEGERYHLLEDDLYLLKAGEMILFSPYVMHRSYGLDDVPFKRIVLYFTAEAIDSLGLKKSLDAGNGVYRLERQENYTLRQMLNTLIRIPVNCAQFQKEYQHALLNTLLFSLILHARKQEPQPQEKQERINQVIQYIHTHYQEDITLEDLSQRFYVSPSYLCREFKRHTRRTLVQYINVTRIMNAQRKILETELNITQVSEETGFSNLTHFNRTFKSVTGVSPSAYRKTHRK